MESAVGYREVGCGQCRLAVGEAFGHGDWPSAKSAVGYGVGGRVLESAVESAGCGIGWLWNRLWNRLWNCRLRNRSAAE